MMQLCGAEILSRVLKQSGVEVVFGIPGIHNLLLFETLRQDRIRIVVPTNESSAAFMATGYHRASGKTGILVTVPGPGLTNALTGLAEALLDSSAVVAIVTRLDDDAGHSYRLHEIDQATLARTVVKGVFTAHRADECVTLLTRAMRIAQAGEPGPVVLEVTYGALWEKVTSTNLTQIDPPHSENMDPDESAMDRIVKRIKTAQRIGLYLGQGATGAAIAVRELAEKLNAPVATTWSGRGCLPEDHPLSLGFQWAKDGMTAVNQVFSGCDLILALGVKFSEHGTQGYALTFSCPLVHVDANPKAFNANYHADETICADVSAFVRALLARLTDLGAYPEGTLKVDLAKRRTRQQARSDKNEEGIQLHVGPCTVTPAVFFRALRAAMPSDSVLVTDAGYHQIIATEHFFVKLPRTFLSPTDFQSMGYCIPGALGAAMAVNRPVVALVGDGSFIMSGLELLTLVHEGAPITVIVFNDGYYGIIKALQEEFFGVHSAVKLAPPNFSSLAASLNLEVHSPTGNVQADLSQCISRAAPILLEVGVSYEEQGPVEQFRRRWKTELKRIVRHIIGQ